MLARVILAFEVEVPCCIAPFFTTPFAMARVVAFHLELAPPSIGLSPALL